MALCNPSPRVMATLARAGIPDLIGLSWYFVRVHDAVQVCLSHLRPEHHHDEENPPPQTPRRASYGQHAPWRREVSRSDPLVQSLLTDAALTDNALTDS